MGNILTDEGGSGDRLAGASIENVKEYLVRTNKKERTRGEKNSL